jgi:hypothetical protein
MQEIQKQTYDEERSLYNLSDAHLFECRFAGPKDGESPLKESQHLVVDASLFRPPLSFLARYGCDGQPLRIHGEIPGRLLV